MGDWVFSAIRGIIHEPTVAFWRCLLNTGSRHGISNPTFNAEHVQWMVREHLCVALIREHEALHEELTTRPIRGVSWTVDSAIVYQAEGRQKTLPLLIHELQKRLSVSGATLSKKLSVMQKEGHQDTLFGAGAEERTG
jgi:hypothetical protein